MKNDYAWIEKYRPKKLEEIVGQDDVIKRMKTYINDKVLSQHLLFTGFQGTGKTTLAMVLARELFGESWRSDFLELNSSDESGIDTIRNKVKDFASTESINGTGLKIILLDESDSLTSQAQSALRRIMERYSRVCKFILTCNYSSKIIEPIQSRTALYRFKGIKMEEMKKRLLYICEKESLTITSDALESIIYVSEGDLRNAINSLQSASLLSRDITLDKIYKASGIVRNEDIENLIKKSLLCDFNNAFEMLDYLMILEGFSSLDILKSMFRVVMRMNIENKRKVQIIDKIGEIDFRINEGANERIQMRALIAEMMLIGSD